MKSYGCHLCEAEWDAGELPIREDGSYDCPGCGYTFWAIKKENDPVICALNFIINTPKIMRGEK